MDVNARIKRLERIILLWRLYALPSISVYKISTLHVMSEREHIKPGEYDSLDESERRALRRTRQLRRLQIQIKNDQDCANHLERGEQWYLKQ